MVAEFSIFPVGDGVSLSDELAKVLRMVDESGLDYRLGPMCTVLEGSWERVMAVIRQCHERVLADNPRVITSIKLDDRKGAQGRLEGKVASVVAKAGRKLKT